MNGAHGVNLRNHQKTYRVAINESTRHLTSFTTIRELVFAVRDAVKAHADVYVKTKRLHREISVDNILITKDGQGLLMDWDLCKPSDDSPRAQRQGERFGTWQFISARLLDDDPANRNSVHNLADDLESFVLVLSWVILRFTNTGLDPWSLTDRMATYFDDVRPGRDMPVAPLKPGFFTLRIMSRLPNFRGDAEPGTLLFALMDLCAVRYELPPSEDKKLEYQEILQSLQAADTGGVIGQLLASLRKPLARDPVTRYNERWAALHSSSAVLQLFDDALAHTTWPTGEGQRVENPLVHKDIESRKRKDELEGDGEKDEEVVDEDEIMSSLREFEKTAFAGIDFEDFSII